MDHPNAPEPQPRMPGLALPFALVGAAAGWLSAGFLANPLIHITPGGQQRTAALCAAGVAALVGKALTRWCVRINPFAGPHTIRIRLVLAVVLGGALSGGLTGGLLRRHADSVLSGLANGAICSIAFIPVCALVLAAARRAERARFGSIVASADRREVWAILAAALAVATLGALPDWPASVSRSVPVPVVARSMAIGAGLLTLAILIADLFALRRVDHAIRLADHEVREPGELSGDPAIPRFDLGLGDDVLARIARRAAAYRSRDRAVALILGSPALARAALRRAMTRGGVGLLICLFVLAAHHVAAGVAGQVIFEEFRCERGVSRSCREAAFLLQQEGDVTAAVMLHQRACDRGERVSCAAAGEIYETGEGVTRDRTLAMTFREKACDFRDAASCRELARMLLAAPDPTNNEVRAASLLERACTLGDKASCP